MTGFDEVWLAEYKNKMAAIRGTPPRLIDHIAFSVPFTTPLLNVTQRTHWSSLLRIRKLWSSRIAQVTEHCRGMVAMQRAHVLITRYSIKIPDHDNLVGGAKCCVDMLLIKSETHPNGLGILIDDAPDHLTVDYQSVRVGKVAEQRTEFVITRMP